MDAEVTIWKVDLPARLSQGLPDLADRLKSDAEQAGKAGMIELSIKLDYYAEWLDSLL